MIKLTLSPLLRIVEEERLDIFKPQIRNIKKYVITIGFIKSGLATPFERPIVVWTYLLKEDAPC